MNIILIFIIGISLSMDTFSLALAYGTLSFKKREMLSLALSVGLFHFFMTIIGFVVGSNIVNLIKVDESIIVFIVFLFIGVNMIIESFGKKESVRVLNIREIFSFAFAVSIDSFSVGIGLDVLTNNILVASLVFCLISFLFTYIGLMIGTKIGNIFGKLSTVIGGFTLIILAILYII